MKEEERGSLLVKPTTPLTEETLSVTGIAKESLETKGLSFSEIFFKFVNLIYEKVISLHRTYRFVTFGDWQLNYQLPIECKQKELTMSQVFMSSSNILKLALEAFGSDTTARLNCPADIQRIFKTQLSAVKREGDEVPTTKAGIEVETLVNFFTECIVKDNSQLVLRR